MVCHSALCCTPPARINLVLLTLSELRGLLLASQLMRRALLGRAHRFPALFLTQIVKPYKCLSPTEGGSSTSLLYWTTLL